MDFESFAIGKEEGILEERARWQAAFAEEFRFAKKLHEIMPQDILDLIEEVARDAKFYY